MSTLHSKPPNPVGFNNHSPYDPFFPSSPSDEHLVPIHGDHTPSNPSYHSPSPQPQPAAKAEQGNFSASNTYNQKQQPPQISLANGYHQTPSPHSNTDHDLGDATYEFLSPNPYLSDNGYNESSEHTATPDYGGDGFFLEENFGILDNPEQNLEMNHPAFNYRSHPGENENQTNANTLHSQPASMGAATLGSNSHLMSPVLTDSNGAASRQGTASPTMGHTFAQQRSHFVPPMLNTAALNQANMHHNYAPMQQTPTATEASKNSSPEMGLGIPALARAPSPAIRVEQHTGGDSPIGTKMQGMSGGKRTRSESDPVHLAAPGEPEEEDEDSDDHYNVSIDGTEGARKGLDPESRDRISDPDLPTLNEQDESNHLALKNADVTEWLERSASGSETGAEALAIPKPNLSKRQRARSAGAQTLSAANLQSLHNAAPDAHIPGPGVLIDEESGESESEMDDEIASIDESPPPTTAWQEEPMNDIPGEARPGVYNELPNQPPLYRAKLWQDPLYDSSDPGIKMQPVTSNDAIMRFQQRSNEMETLSRVATWGTRRLSESDLQSLFHRFSISEAPKDGNKAGRDRSSSFFKKLIPRRMNSGGLKLRRTDSNKSNAPPTPIRPTTLEIHGRANSGNSSNLGVPPPNALKRMSSLGKRPKSPRINTGSAVAAMASQIAALGGHPTGSLSATPTACSSPTGGWNIAKTIKRSRSRSDLNGLGLHHRQGSPTGSDFGGLADLWNRQGGPPLPALVAPKADDATSRSGFGDDDDDDDDGEDAGVVMDLSIRPDAIVPTLEGFKANIRQLNPRLPPFMFDRIAQEQLRRFKKLMDFKIKHAQALTMGKCPSGKHCTELGGEPTYLPSKSSSREPEMNHTGFSVAGLGPSDDDVNALAEGIVTPAQFPPGVPMPPVKRLPAEFECSLCFKVKKFHKPSDWSKHVHEDVQPFTCTFATCAEPKSFKRKADWVRHENERHRQLEWWMCNMNDCSHKCYRKDNFVQHLVREHKLPEPKVKTTKAGKPAVRGPSSQKARNAKNSDDNGDDSHDEIDQVWRLVEECRHETPKSPKDEPCKFCGNVCNTWKKLTVHLAKHMEQISMPVLGVVKQKEVTAETIISPIEQRMASHQASMSPSGSQSPYGAPHSPYGMPMSTMGGDIPAGFTSLQPTSAGYFNGAQQSMYQRPSSSTYPSPAHAQQLAATYQRAASPYGGSDYSGYGGNSPGFTSINAQRSYTTNPASSSPENMYSGLRAAPTSQPRSSPFQDDANAYQYVSQQQAYVNSPVNESPVYNFAPSTPTSYPQQHSNMGTPSPTFPSQSSMGMGSVSPTPSFTQQQHAQMGLGSEPQMQYGMTSTNGGADMSTFAQQQAILQQQQQQQAQNAAFQYQQ